MHYTIGFAQSITKNELKSEPVISEPRISIPVDIDGDEFEDAKDECADVTGILKDCAGTDGDDVADKDK